MGIAPGAMVARAIIQARELLANMRIKETERFEARIAQQTT